MRLQCDGAVRIRRSFEPRSSRRSVRHHVRFNIRAYTVLYDAYIDHSLLPKGMLIS